MSCESSIQVGVPKAGLTYEENQRFTLSGELIGFAAKENFSTHLSECREKLHSFSQFLLIPARECAQALAAVVEPRAGQDKDDTFWGIANRIASLGHALFFCLLAILPTVPGFLLRCCDHGARPAISILQASGTAELSPSNLTLTEEQPLHIRTHNLGFVPTTMSTVGDLRNPMQRASEVVRSIVEDEENQPDIIFFQETFHEDATRVLCEGIKSAYPTIVHNVAPHVGGFSSGLMVASKYPIKEVKYERFGHFIGVENLAPRGIIRVTLETANGGEIFLYGVHTQAILSVERAESRSKQLDQLKAFMAVDKEQNPEAHQVLVGDFNTSYVTAWGEDNMSTDQPEKKVMDKLNKEYRDLFLEDHDEVTGQRLEGTESQFLAADNVRLDREGLVEPSGSWYHGPFADRGVTLRVKMAMERCAHGLVEPEMAQGIEVRLSTWGTKQWGQEANTARFDYILVPQEEELTGRVEIRRVIVPKGAVSAATDHLPVDGKIWLKEKHEPAVESKAEAKNGLKVKAKIEEDDEESFDYGALDSNSESESL